MADEVQQNTGIQFEDIVPWVNDSGDTGLSSRLKLKRNFDKIKTWMDNNALTPVVVRELIAQYGAELFLSKVEEDIAQQNITFEKNIEVKEDASIGGRATVNDMRTDYYTGDGMFDTGGLWQYLNGKAKLVVDQIVCRGKFIVNEIEDRIWTYAGGNLIFSAAGSTIFYVEYLDANGAALGYTYINSPWLLKKVPLLARVVAWSKKKQIQRRLSDYEKGQVAKFRCYETSDDGTMQTRNWWHEGDIALCQTLNRVKNKNTTSGGYSGSLSNTVYKRRVIGIGSKMLDFMEDGKVYDYVDLSRSDCDMSDALAGSAEPDWPSAGDVIVQRGSFTDTERQGFSTVEVTGTQRGFKVYDDVSGYSMEGKKKAFLGYDADLKRGLLEVYGDAYIGAMGAQDPHNGTTYVRYNSQTGELEIKAKIVAGSTGPDGQQIQQWVNSLITSVTDDIQTQVDQKAETWYQDANPATTVRPNGWLDEPNSEHVGDMWYRPATQKTYYFDSTSTADGFAGWKQQNIPTEVFDRIDGKAQVFIAKPTTKQKDGYCYRKNDVWILESAYTLNNVAYKAGTIVVATTSSATWDAAHWVKKDMYTDDSAFNNWKVGGYADDLTGLGGRITTAQNTANGAQSAAAAADARAAAIEYVKNALNADTVVDGGLLLTSLIGLRKLVNGSYVTTGGLNSYDGDGTAVALWLGGAMSEAAAKIWLRHNGSGFLAAGNIKWDVNGNTEFSGKITSTSGSIGGFEITTTAIGKNGTIVSGEHGYTYITRSGYMALYNVLNNVLQEALRVTGNANIYGSLFTQASSVQNINGAPLNLNTGANNGAVTNIGNLQSTLNVNASKSTFNKKVEMKSDADVDGALTIGGLLSASGSIKSSSFTLTTSPKNGMIYIVKGTSSHVTVTIPSGYKIMEADGTNTITGSVSLGNQATLLVYFGNNTWCRFNCG